MIVNLENDMICELENRLDDGPRYIPNQRFFNSFFVSHRKMYKATN